MNTMEKVVLLDQIDQKHNQDQLNQLKKDLQAQEDPKNHHTLLLKQLVMLVYHRKISMHILLTKLDY